MAARPARCAGRSEGAAGAPRESRGRAGASGWAAGLRRALRTQGALWACGQRSPRPLDPVPASPRAGQPWSPRRCSAVCPERGPPPPSCCGEFGPRALPRAPRPLPADPGPRAPHRPSAGPHGVGTGSPRLTTSSTSARESLCCSASPRTPCTSTATAAAASRSTETACWGPARCSRPRWCSGT